jgi:pentatricopeptide repeat protein
VLSALGKARQCDTAVRLYTDMTLNGPYPDRVTNLTMISVYERADRFDEGAVLRGLLGMNPALMRRGESPAVAVAVARGEEKYSVPGPEGARVRESEGESRRKESQGISTDASSKSQTPLKPLKKAVKVDKTGNSQVSDTNSERSSKDEEYFPAGIRLSPAGTLKDKLMESGRRRVGQATSGKMTRIGADGGIEEFEESYSSGDAVSATVNTDSAASVSVSGRGGKASDSSDEIEEMDGGSRRGSEGGELRWEKGGGGAASVMTLLGLAGRSAEAEELLLSLEKEGAESLPASLYNAASKCTYSEAAVPCFIVYSSMSPHLSYHLFSCI